MKRFTSWSSSAAGLTFLGSLAFAISIAACGANMPPVEQPPAASPEELQMPFSGLDASIRD
jgi:hypothetical protein